MSTIAGTDPGFLAPVVGYVSAILAAVYLIGIQWRGRWILWRLPDDEMEKAVRKVISVICGVAIVGLWLFATPERLNLVWAIAATSSILLVMSFLFFAFLMHLLTYYVEEADGPSSTIRKPVLGGLWLSAGAREAMGQHEAKTVQDLFRGAAYDPDKLWSRMSRALARVLSLSVFIVLMAAGTLAISGAGFAAQVSITGKAAASVITAEEAPGGGNVPMEME